MTPEDLKPTQTQAQDAKSNPLGDLGIHAAGDPDSAEAKPSDAGLSKDELSAYAGSETGGDLDDATATGGKPYDPDYDTAQPGKTVFKPGELNNAGEDKEYFHPKKDHQFDAPKDANNHALTPDVEVAPDNKVKAIR